MAFFIVNRVSKEKMFGPFESKGGARVSMSRRGLDETAVTLWDENWRAREAARENLIDLTQFGLTPITDHFLHVSVRANDESEHLMVSFTLNEEKGALDRQEAGRRVGRYLAEFFKDLSSDDVTRLAGEITAKHKPKEVFFATSREEIRDIYRKSHQTTGSCMTHQLSYYSSYNTQSGVHPVEAYAGGDLALAYTRDSDGRIAGRAICWPEKKKYGRIYSGDEYKFRRQMEALGYSRGSMEGAKISKVVMEQGPDYQIIAMPYIDGDAQAVTLIGEDLVVGAFYDKGEVIGTGTSGYAQLRMITCIISKKTIRPSQAEELRHPYRSRTVYFDRNLRGTPEYEQNVAVFRGRAYYMGEAETNYEVAVDGTKVPRLEIGYSYMNCQHDGKLYPIEQIVHGYYVENYLQHYARCEINGAIYRRTSLIWMEHGAWWTRDAFRKWGKVVDGKNYSTFKAHEQREVA